MFKLVALDIDGTLLDNNHELSSKVEETLTRVKEKGIRIILASGRDFPAIKPFLYKLETEDLSICMNGCKVYDYSGKLIFDESIDKKTSEEIIKLCEEKEIYIILFMNENIYVEKSFNYMDYENYTGKGIEVGKISKFINNKADNIYKILLVGEHERLLEIKKILKLEYKGKVNAIFSLPQFLEIFSNRIDKGLMLKKIANLHNISPEKVLSIGDWDNDISMIEFAGLGVAMGNGSSKLKEKADFITKTNEEHGVAYALEKFILSSDS